MELLTQASANAIAVVIAIDDGEPLPPDLVATLRREALEVRTVALSVALATPAEVGSVVLLWTRGSASYERLVAWAQRATPPVGLIAALAERGGGAAEAALAAGFDDVVSGCSARELAVRIRAVHRRVARSSARLDGPRRLRFRNVVLDPDSCEAWVEGTAVGLTMTEFTALVALLRAKGGVVSRSQLLEQAWGATSFDIGERSVDAVVLRLRRKLGAAMIETVRGVGFRLGDDGGNSDEPG